MDQKFIAVDSIIYEYFEPMRSDAGDPLLHELRTRTGALGEISAMQISPEQGTFLSILAGATHARNALEIGTFTGYSALCIARGLGSSGRLTCLDQSGEWTAIARDYWSRAGVADRIQLHLGDARATLPEFLAGTSDEVDFVFIDADKPGYDFYYETVLPYCAQGALIIFDNMLRGGRLATAAEAETEAELDENDRALAALNRKLATDPRVESVLLPVADGLNICRKC